MGAKKSVQRSCLRLVANQVDRLNGYSLVRNKPFATIVESGGSCLDLAADWNNIDLKSERPVLVDG